MFSYIVGFLAFLLFFYNPISQFLTPGTSQIRRTPLPQINWDLLAIESNETRLGDASASRCPPDSYSIHVFSREPLVIYIEKFLSPDERGHLLQISDPLYEPATITHDGGDSAQHDTTVRDSEVAVVPRTDVVRCIEDRARALQGWRDEVWIERLRVQRYGPGGHYNHHFDWSSGRGGWGRVSSFMVWVDDSDGQLQGGGTEFPLLRYRQDSRWCRFIDCRASQAGPADSSDGKADSAPTTSSAVIFKPIAGNAVYWENFRSDGTGRGYDETWHAGLPVEKEVKVGLNIWSWGRID
ncbi:2OG-Fe(II) oxygenase family oxidoreductase [Apodospora peruviana]|uniref:2OG-Fe(II) oxygenase family oxidoreductase n=1 Tax=Apodospora peruviana TaxID=516989 RepID=A0AAE0IE46_9PEZI|nr:2OG-Fe(II) oxygenase family oxidoreductase [Apodospora peruviana]